MIRLNNHNNDNAATTTTNRSNENSEQRSLLVVVSSNRKSDNINYKNNSITDSGCCRCRKFAPACAVVEKDLKESENCFITADNNSHIHHIYDNSNHDRHQRYRHSLRLQRRLECLHFFLRYITTQRQRRRQRLLSNTLTRRIATSGAFLVSCVTFHNSFWHKMSSTVLTIRNSDSNSLSSWLGGTAVLGLGLVLFRIFFQDENGDSSSILYNHHVKEYRRTNVDNSSSKESDADEQQLMDQSANMQLLYQAIRRSVGLAIDSYNKQSVSFVDAVLGNRATSRQRKSSPVRQQRDTTIVTYYGSCNCEAVVFRVKAPRDYNIEQGQGKIPYPQICVPVSAFHLVSGHDTLRVFQHSKDDDRQQNDTVPTGTTTTTFAYSFCGECAVHIVNASQSNTTQVYVNIACLNEVSQEDIADEVAMTECNANKITDNTVHHSLSDPIPKRNTSVNVKKAIQRTLQAEISTPSPKRSDSGLTSEEKSDTVSSSDSSIGGAVQIKSTSAQNLVNNVDASIIGSSNNYVMPFPTASVISLTPTPLLQPTQSQTQQTPYQYPNHFVYQTPTTFNTRYSSYEDSKSISTDDDSTINASIVTESQRDPIKTIYVPDTPSTASYMSRSVSNPTVMPMDWPMEAESISSEIGSLIDLSMSPELRPQQMNYKASHEQLNYFLNKHMVSVTSIPESSEEGAK